MMKQGTLATLAFLLSLSGLARAVEVPQAQSAAAAPPAAVLENAPAGTVVFDDDGGRAQIVPKRAVEKRAASYHGGPVVSKGNVQAIFLGSAWREAESRALESRVVSGLAGREHASALAKYGIEASDLPGLLQEDLLDPLENHTVSDLEVQRRLDSLFANGTMGPYEANAVYVIFLAPGLRSKLGNSSSDEDYLAYHNHFHSSAGVVRYVVVPFDSDFSRWQGNARQSLVQALINPEGNAWY
jgi:hypothetical protein